MGDTSRALAALTLATTLLAPAQPVWGLPDSGSTQVRTQPSVAVSPMETTISPDADATQLPPIATKGWLLADLDTGAILAMHNAQRPLRPASTLKLLTALTVVPRLSPEQPYRAVAEDETAEGNRVVLYEGLEYTVENLLHAMLLPSANDAAEALARANGGLGSTVEQMNAEAARLGAVDTTAKNPSGLDEDGQWTTALDLAAIGREALNHPEIADYLALRTADFPGKKRSPGRVIYPIYNQNRLVINNFDGVLGGKSGYTTLARRTYVGAAERDGRRFLVSLLGIGGNTYTTAEVLLDWAFTNADRLNPVGQLPEASAPAAEFDRTITALPGTGPEPASRDAGAAPGGFGTTDSGDPIAAETGARLPAPLTVLTLLAGILVVLRARVYWIGYRRPASQTRIRSVLPATESTDHGRNGSAPEPRGPIDLRSGAPQTAPPGADERILAAGT